MTIKLRGQYYNITYKVVILVYKATKKGKILREDLAQDIREVRKIILGAKLKKFLLFQG